MNDEAEFVIASVDSSDYWNNDLGWVEAKEDATVFRASELSGLNLLIGGKWEEK